MTTPQQDQGAPIVAVSADGVKHQFPGGTDIAIINKAMKQYSDNTIMTINGVATYRGIPQKLKDGSLNPDYNPPDQSVPWSHILGTDNPNDNSADHFVQGVGSGVIKAVGGAVQSAADVLNLTGVKNNLGKKVADYTNAAANTVMPSNMPTGVAGIAGQIGGQMLPYIAGGELLAGGKVAASALDSGISGNLITRIAQRALLGGAEGAVGGATNLESGDTADERNSNRAGDATFGAAMGATLGVSSAAATKLLTKVSNSKALSKVLDNLQQTIQDWKPDATDVGQAVSTRFSAMNDQYQMRVQRLTSRVASTGGVSTEEIAPVVKDAASVLPKITKTDPSANVLSNVVNVLKTVTPSQGKDYEAASKLFTDPKALENPKTVAMLEKAGMEINPRTPPGDFAQLAQVSDTIQTHLNSLGANLDSVATQKLQGIKKALDAQLSQSLDRTPGANTIWNGIKSGYLDAVRPLKESVASGLLSSDPAQQLAATTGLLKSGDGESAAKIAAMITPKAKDAVVKTAIHQAVVESFDTTTQHINAGKFQSYFENPNTKNVLAHFKTTENSKLLQGVQNFLKHDAHAKSGKGFFGPNSGSLASSFGIFSGTQKTVDSVLAGNPTLAPIGHALITAAMMKAIVKGADLLTESVLGRNFLNALSTVTPDTPKFAATLEQWRPRITRVLNLAIPQQIAGGQ